MAFIEFIGIPGAGKSTLRRLLVQRLKKLNKQKYMTSEDAFYYAAKKKIDIHLKSILHVVPEFIALRHVEKIKNRSLWQYEEQNNFLATYGKALNIVLSSNVYNSLPMHDKKNIISAFLRIGSLYQCIKKESFENNFIFFDEGLIQKSIMFITAQHTFKDNESKIVDYLNCIPISDILIYVNSDNHIAKERMTHRPEGLTDRLRNTENNALNKFLYNASNHFVHLVSHLQSRHKIKILQMDNNDSLNDTANILISSLSSSLQS